MKIFINISIALFVLLILTFLEPFLSNTQFWILLILAAYCLTPVVRKIFKNLFRSIQSKIQ